MPKPIVVLMNWNHMPPTEMASLAHHVAEKISAADSTFTEPGVKPSELDAAANRLELAYANRFNGAAGKTEFEAADHDLDALLHTEAYYVNGVANGDVTIIELSGFMATANSRKKAVVPATPGPPKISGNASELHLIIAAVPGATSYCWIIFMTEGATATIVQDHLMLSGAAMVIPDGASRETLRNVIAAGTKITVQVLAQNTAGKSGFSAAVSFTVGS